MRAVDAYVLYEKDPASHIARLTLNRPDTGPRTERTARSSGGTE
jgi:hypothetical protein